MDKPATLGRSAKTEPPASVRPPAMDEHQNLTPDKSQTGDDGDYDSDRERLADMDMVDRASSGRPVLSSTADLGDESGKELQETGQVPQSIPTPTSPTL